MRVKVHICRSKAKACSYQTPKSTSFGHPFHSSIPHFFGGFFVMIFLQKLIDKMDTLQEKIWCIFWGLFRKKLLGKQLNMKSYNHMISWFMKSAWKNWVWCNLAGALLSFSRRSHYQMDSQVACTSWVHTFPIGFVWKEQRMVTWKCLSWCSNPLVSSANYPTYNHTMSPAAIGIWMYFKMIKWSKTHIN